MLPEVEPPGSGVPQQPLDWTPLWQAGIGIGLTVAITAVFWLTDLDLRVQALAFSPVEPHWPLGQAPVWTLVYRLGPLPGLGLGVLATVGLALSFLRPDFARWRYPCLFLVLLGALGPGVVVNVLGKGLAGRPRPEHLAQFGGLLAYRRPFEPGVPHPGSAFLCGHCSMGLMLMGGFYLLRGRVRWLCLAGGLVLGAVQGVGRLLQGAHFASDTALAATLMFTIAACLSPIATRPPRTAEQARHLWRVIAALAGLVVLMVGGSLLLAPVLEKGLDVGHEPREVPIDGSAHRPAVQPPMMALAQEGGGRAAESDRHDNNGGAA